MQFDNIEYFAKTKQNTYGVHAYINLRGDEAGSLHDSVIKNDRKIQDFVCNLARKLYIFTFHIVKITRRVPFFSSKISMITNVILILYNSSINNKLILRNVRFRHHIACFCSISSTKNNSKQLQHCFVSQ